MISQAQIKKIVYTDAERDVAITGVIISEDEFFIEIKNKYDRIYKIGKKSIVLIKDIVGGPQ